MDPHNHMSHGLFVRRPLFKPKPPSVKWVKDWVPQNVVATGGKCHLLKWITEDALKVLKEKIKEPEVPEPKPEPEPTTEVLFLCSYEGCGKTFIEAELLKQHSSNHGDRKRTCDWEGCGKKFSDSSKLKRHQLIHTGERPFICPHEGCGKAFSLDFNLKSHMKTHYQENYHFCPYPGCPKRFTIESKLKNHIASQHEKNSAEVVKYTPPVEKPVRTPKRASGASGSASSYRPYACPYEGCEKAYMHEYKLTLHLKSRHPGHYVDENAQTALPIIVNDELDEGSDQDAYVPKRANVNHLKQSKPKPNLKVSPGKILQPSSFSAANLNMVKRPWPLEENMYEDNDSEETEENHDSGEDRWKYGDGKEDENEETDYEY